MMATNAVLPLSCIEELLNFVEQVLVCVIESVRSGVIDEGAYFCITIIWCICLFLYIV